MTCARPMPSRWYWVKGQNRAGAAYCWGHDFYGVLGIGGTGDWGQRVPSPTAVLGGHTFRSLEAGGHATCGVTTANAAYCWGRNVSGELGIGTVGGIYSTPQLVTGGHSFSTVRPVGGNVFQHVCGVTTLGDAYCWGENLFGQLGNGVKNDPRSNPTPLAVSGGHKFLSVHIGHSFTCGVNFGGEVLCWGFNFYAQLGDGTFTDRLTPVFTLNP